MEKRLKNILSKRDTVPEVVNKRIQDTLNSLQVRSASSISNDSFADGHAVAARNVSSAAVRQTDRHPGHLRRRILLIAVACMVLVCLSAAAVERGLVEDWLLWLGPNRSAVEENLITSPAVTYQEDTPLLSIESLFADGSNLYFDAVLNEDADVHPYAAKDHIIVNGTDCLNEYFRESPEFPGTYSCLVNLTRYAGDTAPDLTKEEITVDLRLYLKDSDEILPFSFTVPVPNGLEMVDHHESLLGVPIPLPDNGTALVTRLDSTSTKLILEIHYLFAGENAEEHLKSYIFRPVIRDMNDQDFENSTGGMSGYSPIIKTENDCESTYRLVSSSFPSDSDVIKIIPAVWQFDDQGKCIPDSQTTFEEKAFTLNLR